MANFLDWVKNKFGHSNTAGEPPFVETQGWLIHVKGTVEIFSKSDVDKSGKNPKYTYFLTVKVQDITYENCNFQLEETVRFQVKEKQLFEELGREIQKGDQVEIRSTGIETKPRTLPVSSIQLLKELG